MVINDFDIQRITVLPTEANAELVVDADAVLACTVALERFQSVAGRHAQKVECGGGVQLCELAPGCSRTFAHDRR